MTDWYAPNQQAVGTDPAAGGAEPKSGGTGGSGGVAGAFDPADHTVAEVQEYVEANPDQRATVLSAEAAGKNRSTLVDWLSSA